MNKVEELKLKGNDSLNNENYDEAIKFYTQAIDLDSSNHILFSNRSAAFIQKEMFVEALNDSLKTISLKNEWPKGYFRKGMALKLLKKFDEAINAYTEGLKLEECNQQLKDEIKKCHVNLFL
jgi:stress-induced-phosphoprotein 1